jgi:hypothetical protein
MGRQNEKISRAGSIGPPDGAAREVGAASPAAEPLSREWGRNDKPKTKATRARPKNAAAANIPIPGPH